MMIVDLLIWALLGAWAVQITLALGAAVYLVAREQMSSERHPLPAATPAGLAPARSA